MKKFILFIFSVLIFVGCNMPMDKLDITNGAKYIVTSKEEKTGNYHYKYRIIKVGDKWYDKWYDYYYNDSTDFNVGDTLVITVKRVSK